MRFFSHEETVAAQWKPPLWRRFTSIALFNLTTSLPVNPPNRTAGGLNQPCATISFCPHPHSRQIHSGQRRQVRFRPHPRDRMLPVSSHYRIPYTNLTGRGLIFFLPFCRHLTKLLSLSLIKPVFSHFKALGISFGGVPPPASFDNPHLNHLEQDFHGFSTCFHESPFVSSPANFKRRRAQRANTAHKRFAVA